MCPASSDLKPSVALLEASPGVDLLEYCRAYPGYIPGKVVTSVPVSANLSMGMSAMIRTHFLNLLAGFE